MMKNKKVLKIVGGILLTLLLIQFIPYGRDHSNPKVEAEPAWNSPETRKLFFNACANCHSHETKWPGYSKIAPVSWLVQSDVDEAREHFNVSRWGVQKKNHGDDAEKEVREGDMPPWYYVIAHPEARLSDADKKALADGLLATFGGEED